MENDKFTLQFIGLNKVEISEKEMQRLKEISEREANKLFRETKINFNLVIRIKEHEKTGKGDKRKKYSVNLVLHSLGKKITSGGGIKETWDVKIALHKAFANIKNKIRTSYKGDSSWKKSYE